VIDQAKDSVNLDLDPANLPLQVSLEPKGGSTTGTPTGPIVFTGTLLAGN
jgi:anti-sigma-K factor RskA